MELLRFIQKHFNLSDIYMSAIGSVNQLFLKAIIEWQSITINKYKNYIIVLKL